MPRDMYVHEHPEAPRLKSRVFRRVDVYAEEELEAEGHESESHRPEGSGESAEPAADPPPPSAKP
jgi:hypothetical protein